MGATRKGRFVAQINNVGCCLRLVQYAIAWISLIECVKTDSNDELSFVIVLYRHGDRSPIHTFANDRYQEDFWPQGFGQLTQIGMEQEYHLGQYLKERYITSGYLNATYLRHQVSHHGNQLMLATCTGLSKAIVIYVRSTDYERTLMSAESVLAGFYPPHGDQVWNTEIPWQPIPVHTIPQGDDTVMYDFPCDKLKEEDVFIKQSEEYLAVRDSRNDTLRLLQANTGDNITTLDTVGYIQDALLCEMSHNLSLPGWASPALIRDLVDSYYPTLASMYYKTFTQKRLRGGHLLAEYFRRINASIAAENDTLTDSTMAESPRMIMFSAHDSTVQKLMGTLGVFNKRAIPYSTMVMLEVYKSVQTDYHTAGGDQHSVVLLYRNDTTREPYRIKLPDCPDPCPYPDFVRLYQPLVPDDLVSECRSSHYVILGVDLHDLLPVVLLSMGAGLLLLVSLLVCVVCCCVRCCRPRRPLPRRYGRIRAENVPEEVPMINSFSVGSDLDD